MPLEWGQKESSEICHFQRIESIINSDVVSIQNHIKNLQNNRQPTNNPQRIMVNYDDTAGAKEFGTLGHHGHPGLVEGVKVVEQFVKIADNG
jgi:hypothetical protein